MSTTVGGVAIRSGVAALGLWLLVTGLAAGQPIRIGENVLVSRGLERRPLVEPHLVAHPSNPAHLLATAIVGGKQGAFDSTQTCATFLSTDAGKTWTRHDFELSMCGDPWVGIAPDGNAVFTTLAEHKGLTQQHGGAIVVFHSPDGGKTWPDPPIGLGRGHDHQTVAIDMSSKRKNTIYVVSGQGMRAEDGKLRWSVSTVRSRNGGKAFDEPVKFVPSSLNINAEVPVVLSDGTLLVSHVGFQRNVGDFGPGGMLERSHIYVSRSTDGGHSFSIPLFVTETCGSGWSWMAVDSSAGPYHDRVYHACVSRDPAAITIRSSSDGGEVWTDGVVVHSAPADSTVYRRIPSVAVNAQGIVGVSWLDGRDDPSRQCQALYFAASVDGGKTFLPEQRVTTPGVRSCPDSAGSGATFKRWPTGGDYYGLAAAADGRFHAFWADHRTGVFQLYSAAIEVVAK